MYLSKDEIIKILNDLISKKQWSQIKHIADVLIEMESKNLEQLFFNINEDLFNRYRVLSMNKVNINDYVYFKLTPKGEQIVDDYCNRLNKEIKGANFKYEYLIKINDQGIQYTQLWDFIKIFSNNMYNGAKPVIENNNIYFK